MTREQIEKLPIIVAIMLSGSVTVNVKENIHEQLTEVCNLAVKALEQEPFINKPCVSSGVCEHDKNKVLDKIRADINTMPCAITSMKEVYVNRDKIINILDKYKAETEE